MDKRHTRISKFLSYVLRHRPDEIGLVLDSAGWVDVDRLLAASAAHGTAISRDELDYVVAHNDKQRFAISEDGRRIRASQGHSTDVELGYEPRQPPEALYHGTATHHLPGIRERGLVNGKRHHVHLSSDEATARLVGQRHGRVVVLRVRAGEMARAGFAFYLSANGVWLTDAVPPRYVDETDSSTEGPL
jgi:putative RNA 2'-phosphotransferase